MGGQRVGHLAKGGLASFLLLGECNLAVHLCNLEICRVRTPSKIGRLFDGMASRSINSGIDPTRLEPVLKKVMAAILGVEVPRSENEK